ncbi:MAG: methyltransferase domain-containing protein [Saprospiraceae bacterium]|nr:methyltransferase domain-containing protein [Lewinella sp.]
MDKQQEQAINYYDKFSAIYDWISSRAYYRKPREYAIRELELKPGQLILNVPCGTGQNFEYFQEHLSGSGKIVGVDLSGGMLGKARQKIASHHWNNIELFLRDVTTLDKNWVENQLGKGVAFDAILCDLGLSGFPQWQQVIDNLLSLLKPGGKLVIMDWYLAAPTWRGRFIAWVGKGEVDRPLYQYLEKKVTDFKVNTSFKKGEMFVASGKKSKSV